MFNDSEAPPPFFLISTYKISDSPLLKPSGKMLLNNKYFTHNILFVFHKHFFSSLGIIALSVNSPTEIKVSLGSGSTIVLNCTFEKEISERVSLITWTKKQETEDQYITIIAYVQSSMYLNPAMINRDSSITYDDSSPSVILNISEVLCRDNGQYICIVDYLNSNGTEIRTSTETSVYIQGKKVYKEF